MSLKWWQISVVNTDPRLRCFSAEQPNDADVTSRVPIIFFCACTWVRYSPYRLRHKILMSYCMAKLTVNLFSNLMIEDYYRNKSQKRWRTRWASDLKDLRIIILLLKGEILCSSTVIIMKVKTVKNLTHHHANKLFGLMKLNCLPA